MGTDRYYLRYLRFEGVDVDMLVEKARAEKRSKRASARAAQRKVRRLGDKKVRWSSKIAGKKAFITVMAKISMDAAKSMKPKAKRA